MSLSARLREQEEQAEIVPTAPSSIVSGGTMGKMKAPRGGGGPIMDDRRQPPRSNEQGFYVARPGDEAKYSQTRATTANASIGPTVASAVRWANPRSSSSEMDEKDDKVRDDSACAGVQRSIQRLKAARRRSRCLRAAMSIGLAWILFVYIRRTLRGGDGPKVVEDGGPKITSANAGTSWNPLKRVWSSFGGRSGTAAQTKNLRVPADDPPLKMATVVVPAVVPDVVPDDQRSEQRPPGVVVHAPPFPSNLDHLSNLTQPYRREHEAPYFWDVHFSGETVAEAIFGQCHYLVQACEHGTRQPHFNEDKLEVFYLDGVRYVNVDTTTPDGIDRAGRLGLAKSGDADVIISPNLHLMSTKVFSTVNSGRMFALFRDPVDRAMTMYYYLSKASWDPMYNPKLAKMTIEEYAQSGFIENNWVTRFLVDKPGGKLTKQDMLMAKNIIRYKCLVGLYSDLESSMSRFQRYFGWNAGDTKTRNDDIPKCRKAFIEAGDKRMQHEQLDKRSRAWSLIEKQNKFDMELYEFSKRIFKVQGKQIFNVVG